MEQNSLLLWSVTWCLLLQAADVKITRVHLSLLGSLTINKHILDLFSLFEYLTCFKMCRFQSITFLQCVSGDINTSWLWYSELVESILPVILVMFHTACNVFKCSTNWRKHKNSDNGLVKLHLQEKEQKLQLWRFWKRRGRYLSELNDAHFCHPSVKVITFTSLKVFMASFHSLSNHVIGYVIEEFWHEYNNFCLIRI